MKSLILNKILRIRMTTPTSERVSAVAGPPGVQVPAGNASRINYVSLRENAPHGGSSYTKRALDRGVTPAGIMPGSGVEAAIRNALAYLGLHADDAAAVIGFIVSFAVVNSASDRVLVDPSTDPVFPLFTAGGAIIDVEVVPFFNNVFGANVSGSNIRQFVRAFPKIVMQELQVSEGVLADRFGIADVYAARGDLLPKHFIEQNKYAAERLKAAKAEAVYKGVEHAKLNRNGGASYETQGF